MHQGSGAIGREAYRRDIDGLRAVAVLSVVLFHFGLNAFGGGFVGVDIFFVISGFLITAILRRDIEAGQFSLVSFYARRIRRIVPALAVVLLFTLAVGWWLVLPSDYASLGAQAGFAAVGLSNFYFLTSTDYFDRAAELQPLLHTWSLAVEEQFYLLWPGLLLVLYTVWRRRQLFVVWGLGLLVFASLGWSIYAVATRPEAAFYMLPSRAWELALGGLVAFLPPMTHARALVLSQAVALALIGGSVVLLEKAVPFPGLAALPACLGAALLVWPKEHPSIATQLLASPPLVGIGLISYSLYLWHWPILVFYRVYANDDMPNSVETMGLLAVSLAVATLSWKYVEQPFRRRKGAWVPLVATAAALVGLVAGVVVTFTEGAPWRFTSEVARLDTFRKYATGSRTDRCSAFASEIDVSCAAAPAQSRVLLVGDSHAMHFISAFRHVFPDVALATATAGGCRPLLGFEAVGDKAKTCVALMTRAFDEVIPKGKFDVVILSGRWRNQQSDKLPETVKHVLQDVPTVIVFGQTLEYTNGLPEILLNDKLWRRPIDLAKSRRYDRMKAVDLEVRRRLQDMPVKYYSVIDAICPKGPESCISVTPEGSPMSYDYGHLTRDGAIHVLTEFKKQGLQVSLSKP